MRNRLRKRLAIPPERLQTLNSVLLDPDSRQVNELLDVVLKYGTPEEINHKAAQASQLESLLARLAQMRPKSKTITASRMRSWLLATGNTSP